MEKTVTKKNKISLTTTKKPQIFTLVIINHKLEKSAVKVDTKNSRTVKSRNFNIFLARSQPKYIQLLR